MYNLRKPLASAVREVEKQQLNAAARLLAALPKRPTRAVQPKWLDKTEQKIKQKPENKPELPDGLFTQGPSAIAQGLKTHSKSFEQAIGRLSFYRNRGGSNLSSADKHRLDQAKEALYQAYGKELPKADKT